MNGKREAARVRVSAIQSMLGRELSKRLQMCDGSQIAQEGEFARVGLYTRGAMLRPVNHGLWYVSVWGFDDYGLTRDFATYGPALSMYRGLPQPLTEAKLFELGFDVF